MTENNSPEQPAQPSQVASSQISKIFGPTRLLPGESEDVYNAGLLGTIKELGATTYLQTYIAEKIFQSLWWMRRYEIQKQTALVNAMVDLLSTYETPKIKKHAMTQLLQDNLWHIPEMKKVIEGAGYSAESLLARGMNTERETVQKFDYLIALRVKTLGQLQQSYEALVNRSIVQERLKLQNELLKRDLQAIDVTALKTLEAADSTDKEIKGVGSNGRGKPKAKSSK